MDWTAILCKAGIPDVPGRNKAIAAAAYRTELKLAAASKPRPSGKGKRSQTTRGKA